MRDVKLCRLLGALAGLVLASSPVLAGDPIQVPEPSVLSLLGLAGVVAVVAAIRHRKK